MDINKLSSNIIRAAINVHKELGPGLLESVYQICLAIVLNEMGIKIQTEVDVPIEFRGKVISDHGFRIDILAEDKIIIELKSVKKIEDIHRKQLLTYLKIAQKPLGLLLNFNEVLLKDGITRIIHGEL